MLAEAVVKSESPEPKSSRSEPRSQPGNPVLDCSIATEDDFALECLGLLANLRLKELDFARVLRELGLLAWFKTKLMSSDRRMVEDDFLLEIIKFLGTASADEKAASLVSEAGFVGSLVDLLNCK